MQMTHVPSLNRMDRENEASLTDGVGRQARRIASELECSGLYLGSWRIGCILKGCLLFIDIMIAEVKRVCRPSSSFASALVFFFSKRRIPYSCVKENSFEKQVEVELRWWKQQGTNSFFSPLCSCLLLALNYYSNDAPCFRHL